MRFAFTAEQLELRDAVRSLLTTTFPPSALRQSWTAPDGDLDRSAFDALARMGVMDMLVPTASGGLGLDWCSLVLVLEECGRVALPHPVVESAAVAAPLLGRPCQAMVTASLAGEPAACGLDSDFVLLERNGALRLLPLTVAATEGAQLESIDRARRLLGFGAASGTGDRTGAEAMALAGELVTDEPTALAAAFDRAALGASAELLGLSQTMLDMTVGYVTERRQFGAQVGSFQAVKHRLADALKELEFARPVVYRAAWSLSVDDGDASLHVSMAKAMASEAAQVVAEAALQCHGAIGYAYEHDLHLYMKRAWALARASGTVSWHRARLGRSLAIGTAQS